MPDIDMTTEVVNGVIAAIKTAFPSVDVFDEPVDQGIVEPSFVVRCVRPGQEQFLGRRYRKTHLIEIVYFPPAGERFTNCNAVSEQLFDALEVIQAGNDPIRGWNMDSHYSEDNNALIFTVNYNYFVIRENNADLMDTLHIEWKG